MHLMSCITWENGSRQPMFLIVTSILLLFSTLAVSLRLYCRVAFIRQVGLDDYFSLAALVVAICLGVMNAFHVSWGTGYGLQFYNRSIFLVPTLKHWYAYQMVYPWALFFVKTSILALYHRIFKQKRFRRYIYGVMSFVATFTIVILLVNALECGSTVSRAWSPTFPAGCNNISATYFSAACINILTDIVILVMPLRAFKHLNLSKKKRWALKGVFKVGGVAIIASMMRLYALWLHTVTKDVAYDAIFILLLSQIEVNVAIISASAPGLRPLFNTTFLSSTGSSKYNITAGRSEARNSIITSSYTARPQGPNAVPSFGQGCSISRPMPSILSVSFGPSENASNLEEHRNVDDPEHKDGEKGEIQVVV